MSRPVSAPRDFVSILFDRMEAITRAEEELLPFTKLVLPDPKHPEDPLLSRYRDAKHHRAIAAALEEFEKGTFKRLIINCPPRHGKTELASKKFIGWYSGRNPTDHVIFGTYNQTFADEIGRAVRDVILHPAYAQVFPNTGLRDNSKAADRLETIYGGILAFVGRGGTTTGRGANLIVIDDPIKDRKEANSRLIRDQLWQWFQDVIKTRLMDDNGKILLIQTRWHEDDLVGRLTDPTNEFYDEDEAAQWKVIDLPALAFGNDPLGRKEGEPLWPERFNRTFLEDQRRSNPKGFSALYQGRPSPDGGAFFRSDTLATYKPNELPKQLRIYAASDHAVSMEQDRDKTVLLVVGVDDADNIWVLPDTIMRQMTTDQTVTEMLKIMKARKPLIWWAEKSHITKSIGPFLRKRMREDGVNCAIHEVTPIADKQTRAQSIQGRIEMGRVFFPERAPWWPEARDQLVKFPQAAHDDFVDAIAYVGLGLGVQVRAMPLPDRLKTPTRMTFGDLIKASNAERAERAMARDTGGW